MTTFFNPTRVSGLLFIGIGLVLLSQTFGLEGDFFDDGIHPFTYPRLLVYALLVLGAIIALTGKGKPDKTPFPIFNWRSVGLGLTVLLYAATFSTVGFLVSSFAASVACGVIMGWGNTLRRCLILAVVNAIVLGLVWVLFWRILRIPLPAGTLW